MSHSRQQKKKILVAPLHWGLGHATRCIPIINALNAYNFEPIIASDGAALELLKKEFPSLRFYELPSYNISYSKTGNRLFWKFIKASPRIYKTIKRERKVTESIVKTENIAGIISDNRFGVWLPEIPSVYVTHQLKVLSGKTTWITSKWHQDIVKKYTECWVPDVKVEPNLSGDLGHINKKIKHVKYIGPLSRFQKKELKKTTDILVILSGPEPQRTLLEKKLISELQNKKKSIVLIRGVVEKVQSVKTLDSIKIYNYMTSNQLEDAINACQLVVCRSGYTSIMDLYKLKKNAFFIPTPGQYEQLYLAKKLNSENIIPSSSQEEFKYDDLNKVENFVGFSNINTKTNFETLFHLF